MKRKACHLGTYLFLLMASAQLAAQSQKAFDHPSFKVGMALPRPHVAALRQQLGLSPHLHFEWRPSRTGSDTLRVTDDFNRADIGPDWALDSRYWAIKEGELVLTSAAIYEWRYLAVFTPVFNNDEREIYSVTYTWGKKADAVGIGEGAHALMIDAPSAQGDGYWLWRRTNQNSVWLYAINDGTWEYTPGESKEFHRAGSHTPIPQAGDVITAVIRNDEPQAVYFDYYINDRWDATVYDASKEFAQSNEWYTGVFIHGQDLNNQVDDFTVTWFGADNVPPAAVTDLRAIDSSASSVTLAWTSPGDNYWDGQADHLEIRSSTVVLDEDNFESAALAANIPEPATSGEEQRFTVSGLQANTTYYFALRVYDEADNAGGLSNVVRATTKSNRVAAALALTSGCDQTGVVGAALPQPLVVAVKDQEGAAFANYPVQFVVKNGEARFENDAAEITVNSNEAGEAAAQVWLGTSAGAIELEISAANLSGSPILCQATARAGAATDLVQVSGDQQLLSAGRKSAPLVVRVTDAFGNSVVDHELVFTIASGGGRFVNGEILYQTQTALNGTASAELFASESAGDTTVVVVQAGADLKTQFALFAAAADSLRAVRGNDQSAPVGTQLAEPLVARVLDMFGASVKNFPVMFTVIAGGGKLANGNTSAAISTDSSGVATTTWTLGPNLGLNQVRVEAAALKGSPLLFNATATGVSGVHESSVALPTEFALLPNSPNPFNPETTIHFTLPEAAEVSLVLFDATGRQVRNLMHAALRAGAHIARWDGRAAGGRSLDSGVYFCRMHAVAKVSGKDFTATRKLVLMK